MELNSWNAYQNKDTNKIAAELIREEIDLLSRDGEKLRFRAVAQKRWNITVTYAILMLACGIFSKLASPEDAPGMIILLSLIVSFQLLNRKMAVLTALLLSPFPAFLMYAPFYFLAGVCYAAGSAIMLLPLLIWILRMVFTTNAKACSLLLAQAKKNPSAEFRQLVKNNVLDPEVPSHLIHRSWFHGLLVILALLPGLLLPSLKEAAPQVSQFHDNGLIYAEIKEYYILIDCEPDFAQTDVFVPDQVNGRYVAGIGSGAFMNETTIETVRLPDFIVLMGAEAFSGCTNLQSIVIPHDVTEIRGNCFENCTSLASVTLHDGITAIHGYAFRNCTSLESILLPKNITEIRGNCFENCTSLRSIVIPDGVTRIAAHAFMGCSSLVAVSVPSTVTELGSSAFRDCPSLKSIVIPEGASVDERTFKNSPTTVTRK